MATLVKRDQMLYGMQIFVVDFMQRLGTGKLYDRMEAATQTLQTLIQEGGLTGHTALATERVGDLGDDGTGRRRATTRPAARAAAICPQRQTS